MKVFRGLYSLSFIHRQRAGVFVAVLMVFSNVWAQKPSSNKLNLKSIYRSALEKNERLGIQKNAVDIAKEARKQALGSALPNLSAVGQYTRYDTAQINTQEAGVKEDQTQARLSLTQPLFQGFREWNADSAAKLNVKAEELAVSSEKLNLFSQTAQSFYSLLAAKKDLEDINAILNISEKRVKELQRRVRIGRSRSGDLISAQAQVSSLKAQKLIAENQIKQYQFELSLISGLDIKGDQLIDDFKVPLKLDPLDDYLSKASKRPDIQSQAKRVEANQELVAVAKGAHAPSLDLSGNYYFKREGSLEDSKWDVGLTLTIPLFEGGVTSSRVRERSHILKESQLQLSYQHRAAEQSVKTYYDRVKTGMSQIKALEDALNLNERNYREQNRDYGLGLVNNLEVIQSLNNLVEARRLFHRINYQVKADYAQLLSSTGQLQD